MKLIKYLIPVSMVAMASNLFAVEENIYARCNSTTQIVYVPPMGIGFITDYSVS